MTCPPFCDRCGGNLGRGGTERECEKCLRSMPKKRIRASEFDPGNWDHFALKGGNGRGWRYYEKVQS
jgi:hypothetical protein